MACEEKKPLIEFQDEKGRSETVNSIELNHRHSFTSSLENPVEAMDGRPPSVEVEIFGRHDSLGNIPTPNFVSSMGAPTTFGGYQSLDYGNLHCHTKDEKKMSSTKAAQRKLVIASIVCLLFMIGEFVGGYLSNSLAIMTVCCL